MVILLLVALGLVLGSFVNAFTWRLRHHEDWVKGRSECSHCHHPLAAADLVPVLSWLWLHGRCRYCHKKIEDNPLVEAVLPVLFVVSYQCWPHSVEGREIVFFGAWLAMLTLFLSLVVYDTKWAELPDAAVIPLIIIALAYTGGRAWEVHDLSIVVSALGGVLSIAGLFYVLYKVSNERWIGLGDVTLGVALGLLAGSVVGALFLLFIASMTGLVGSLPKLLHGKAKFDSRVPFGPFLILAVIVVVLFGERIMSWYTGLFYV